LGTVHMVDRAAPTARPWLFRVQGPAVSILMGVRRGDASSSDVTDHDIHDHGNNTRWGGASGRHAPIVILVPRRRSTLSATSSIHCSGCGRPRRSAHLYMTSVERGASDDGLQSGFRPALPTMRSPRMRGSPRRFPEGVPGGSAIQGGSQGGWVAAACGKSRALWICHCLLGLAVSVIDEDQQEVEIENAREKSLAGGNRECTGGRTGCRERLCERLYRRIREFDAVEGEVQGRAMVQGICMATTRTSFCPTRSPQLREMGAQFRWGTPFHFDPMPTLRAATAPQLWILGGRIRSPEVQRQLVALGRSSPKACHSRWPCMRKRNTG